VSAAAGWVKAAVRGIEAWALPDDPEACGCCGDSFATHTTEELRGCAEVCKAAVDELGVHGPERFCARKGCGHLDARHLGKGKLGPERGGCFACDCPGFVPPVLPTTGSAA
jgi:hypothetical protein